MERKQLAVLLRPSRLFMWRSFVAFRISLVAPHSAQEFNKIWFNIQIFSFKYYFHAHIEVIWNQIKKLKHKKSIPSFIWKQRIWCKMSDNSPYTAFLFKMWFIFKMCFHFQNVKGFVSIVFPFSEKHNSKQKSVHSILIALLMRLWTNNEIYTKLLNLFQLQRIYNSSYPPVLCSLSVAVAYIYVLLWGC